MALLGRERERKEEKSLKKWKKIKKIKKEEQEEEANKKGILLIYGTLGKRGHGWGGGGGEKKNPKQQSKKLKTKIATKKKKTSYDIETKHHSYFCVAQNMHYCPSLISFVVSVDRKHHVYLIFSIIST